MSSSPSIASFYGAARPFSGSAHGTRTPIPPFGAVSGLRSSIKPWSGG
jgi:hypothetical protein